MSDHCKIPSGTKVLITGATGFTGSHLVRKLVESGLKVNAIARSSSNIAQFEKLPIQWFRGDVFDPETVKQASERVEYIFHVAAAFREAKISDDVYAKVHVESTKLLAQEALKQPHFKRFLHTSTIGVHSHIEDPPADENYRFAPDDLYQKTKATAELWIREFSKDTGLPVTVVRPAAIYGPGDRRLFKLFKMAKKGWFPLLDGHNTLYHLIHVEDLARFYLFCATSKEAENDVFICGNKKDTSIKEMLSIIAETYKKNIRFISIPSKPLFMAADVCEYVSKKIRVEPFLYRRRVAFFTKDRSFNTAKIHEKLHFKANYNNEDGIRQTAQWYREHKWL